MEPQEMTFGQRLRATRLGAGMSQSDLEERSGIPKARLSRYENGHVAPSIQTLERLARALGVTQASLLGEEPGARTPSPTCSRRSAGPTRRLRTRPEACPRPTTSPPQSWRS